MTLASFVPLVLVVVGAVLLDAVSGGWSSISPLPPLLLATLAVLLFVFSRRRQGRG